MRVGMTWRRFSDNSRRHPATVMVSETADGVRIVSHDEMIRFWGAQALVRWPRRSLDEIGLPEDAKAFLTEVGLPVGIDWTLRLSMPSEEMPRPACSRDHVVIGYDDEVPICLSLRNQGQVVAIDVNRTRFVNTSVSHFAQCLVHYQRYRLLVRGLDNEEASSLIEQTEQAMQSTDSAAFGKADLWWPVIVEQMYAGFL